MGELSHILKTQTEYNFIESDDTSAEFLIKHNPRAKRTTINSADIGGYDAIFAIDSLEHNENYDELIEILVKLLSPGGNLIVSGPTENALYRMGRRIAGFTGEYHHTTIFDIEAAVAKRMTLLAERTVPFGLPLFRITVWNTQGS